MPITTTAPTISTTGISAPTFADVYAFLVSKYQGIFGSDVYVGPDSQDGQFLAVVAQALSDTNSACVAVYNAFSPQTAVGTGLSSVVKLNGITREPATFSTVDVLLTGTVGTTITNGVVSDGTNRWDLPTSVTIPTGGTITVTATCETSGPVASVAGTVTKIVTPTLGWTSVTNPSASALGTAIESDAILRQRQTVSVALPSRSILDGLSGAIEAINGVTRIAAYENDTGSTVNTLPPFSLTMVVEGGDDQLIANAIALKKSPGVSTHGTTSATVTTPYNSSTIFFFRPVQTVATIAISLKALAGYTTDIGKSIQSAIATYINSSPIGKNLQLSKLYLPANLYGNANSNTFDITAMTINGVSSDLTIDIMNVPFCDPTTGVTITVS